MKTIIAYFRFIGRRRLVMMLIGIIIIGAGIGIFKFANLGNDPYSGMCIALSGVVGMSYPTFLMCLNLAILVLEFILCRYYIGPGTIVSAVLIGYVADFLCNALTAAFPSPGLVFRLVAVLIGVIICSMGISLYQKSDAGISPYDSMTLFADFKLKKIPYFWVRIFFDSVCAFICFLAGGVIGIGTLATVFGYGPFVQFFDRYSEKLVGKKGSGSSAAE